MPKNFHQLQKNLQIPKFRKFEIMPINTAKFKKSANLKNAQNSGGKLHKIAIFEPFLQGTIWTIQFFRTSKRFFDKL